MKKCVAALALMSMVVVTLGGCATTRAGKGGTFGAIIGAVLGAGVAVATGHSDDAAKYALVGGAAGAAVGYSIGKARDKKLADRDAAVARAAYRPEEGFRLDIVSVEAVPQRVSPGNTSQVIVTWMAISPRLSEQVQVRADFTFRLAGGQEGKASSEDLLPLENGGGIVETTIDLPIPPSAPAGSYALDVRVADSLGRAVRDSSIPVFVG